MKPTLTTLYVVVLAACMSISAHLPVRSTQPVNKKESAKACEVKFSIENAGIEVTGTIERATAEVRFNPQDLANSTIKGKAYPSTLSTGIAIRDKHLKRSDYFDVALYQQIKLESGYFVKKSRGHFIGEFDLTIKNVMKKISIPFTIRREGNTVHYSGKFTINRLDFHLGEESSILGETVSITVDIRDNS